MFRQFFYIIILHSIILSDVNRQVLKSDSQELIIEYNINAETESDLYPISLLVGLPTQDFPEISISFENYSVIPFDSQQEIKNGYEWTNKQRLQGLETATLKINSLISNTSYYKKIIIMIKFEKESNNYRKPNSAEIEFLKDRIVNWSTAKTWFVDHGASISRNINNQNGMWFQFFINQDGMNAIEFSLLDSLIDNIQEFDPRSFSIFMSNQMGRPIINSFNQPILDNLIEVSILIKGENDGVFNGDDKIIFYGRGPSGFDLQGENIEWVQNVYFSSNSCWLFIPDDDQYRGKRVNLEAQPNSGILLDYGISSHHIESDLINLEASGTEWVSNPIPSGGSQPILLNLGKPKLGTYSLLSARFRGHSLTKSSLPNHQLSLTFGSVNGEQLGSITSWTGNSSRLFSLSTESINLNEGVNIFYIKNLSPDNDSYPYLDYFELRYGRELNFDLSYEFQTPISNQDLRLSFSGEKPSDTRLWNISDPANIIGYEIDDEGFCNISSQFDNQNRYILFSESNLNFINNLTKFNNLSFSLLRQQNLQADYVIVGPDKFRNEAEDLLSLRSPSIYASIEQIYLEFSGGNTDPLAIRSFVQWTQEMWGNPQPTCFLFLGESGYDYRNITGQSTIIIPTIQVQSSRTYATDDLLTTIYGSIPEVATGRYPARNEQEVIDFVNKVVSIDNETEFGPWRQKVTLIADDAARPEPKHGSISTGKSHTINSEQLSEVIPPSIQVEKIYMMEYPEVSDASAYGVAKPGATDAVFDALNSGTAIISYIGHGSPYQLAQEKLLDLNRGDLNQIVTGKKLPIWIVGTCSFGHFDDPTTESFAEELIRSPQNAASAVISTSRPITVVGNERYTLDIFEKIFENNSVSQSKVGIILQSIKDGSSESKYFHLFGDPAMRLPMPFDTLTSINISSDTLKTLETANYFGEQNSFLGNGNGYVILKDAPRSVTREYEISSETHSLSYNLPGPTLFRGQFTFSNLTFSGEIRIPQDISYSDKPATLLLYIYNEANEARSAIKNIHLIGGEASVDNFGPNITFENQSGKRLEYGDHFPNDGKIIIRISDPLGINLTNETGHEISIQNLNTLESESVTNNFVYDKNSITSGTINFETNEESIHLTVKAWDNANNPSEKEMKLIRSLDNNLRLYNVYNFPNPFSNGTRFCFEVTNNVRLNIDVYSLGGKKVWSYSNENINSGYHSIEWNGKDFFYGDIANGVYLYKIEAFGNNSKTSHIGKCAKYQ